MAGILDAPVAANCTSRSLHADREGADVVADFIGGSSITHAMTDH